MSQPTYIVTTDQPTTVVVSPDQVVASVPANVQGPAGPAGPAPAGTGLVRVTDGVASTLTHPSPSPAGSYTLASITVDAFGRVTAASNGMVTAATIADSTATGRAVLTAADAAAARSAISAAPGTLAANRVPFADATGVVTSSGDLQFYPGAGLEVGGYVLSTNFAQTLDKGRLNSSGLRLASDSHIGFTSSVASSGTVVLGINRLDDNTVEINNGTRTGSGGAPRGLSVSTLTVATGATGGTGISVTGTGSNVEQIRITTGLGGAVPAIVLSQGAGGIPSGSVELSFSSPKLGLRRTGLDHFCYYSTATGDTVLDSVFGGAGAEIRSGGTLRIRATSAGTAITGPLTLGTYTVATLPSASANAGAFAQVTDSNSTTNGNTVAGGGSNRVPVFSNGTNWIIK